MKHMFFKKELQTAGGQEECERIKKMLENAGIKYSVNKTADAVRGGGSDQFQILVKRKDFKKARSLFKF